MPKKEKVEKIGNKLMIVILDGEQYAYFYELVCIHLLQWAYAIYNQKKVKIIQMALNKMNHFMLFIFAFQFC